MNLNATLIIEIISFLLLLFILHRFLYKPLISFMDRRGEAVRDMIRNAQEAEDRARIYTQESHKALDMAREEALKIKEETKRLSDTERRRIIKEAQKEAYALIEQARAQLGRERELMLEKIKSEIATISIDIAKRILGREINKEDHHRLIEESIVQIEDAL